MGKIQKIREEKRAQEQLNQEFHRKKTKKTILIIVIIAIIAALLVFGIVFLSKNVSWGKTVRAIIETDKGNIELALNKEAAPNTVENFVKLAESGFYDGVKFHRVVNDFVIQAGDPLSKDNDPNNDGQGGPGYTFDDEINPRALNLAEDMITALQNYGYTFNFMLKSIPHKVGTISMANSGPNTNGSQFFIITTKDQPNLDGMYTAFGQVVKGMDVVQNIKQGDIINKVIIK